MDRPLYPFTAVVGQERAKQALLCLAVEPRIGGVLLCGEKGTAKSTLVRALGGLDGVRLLELPVSATEDMLLGGVELEAAVRTGCRTFQPGLLARADGAVLYADEVNLLPSALTAALLDTLETGVCRVERDGISHTCPARFALVGTMNPEEGTLRPQLLDRFGLYVAVTGEREPEARKEVVRRRLAFEETPAAFRAQWARREERLAGQLAAARALLPQVDVGEAEEQAACLLARQANAAGHRAELAILHTARALAAYVVTENVLGQYCVIERNDSYWGTPGIAKTFRFKVIPDAETRYTALRAGEVQGLCDLGAISPSQAAEIDGDPAYNVSVGDSGITHFLNVNGGAFPFNDVRMREGLSLLLDRQTIIDSFYNGYGLAAGGFLNYTSAFYREQPVQHDPERGAELIREVVGDQEVELLFLLPGVDANRYPYQEEAEYIQSLLENIEGTHIKVSIQQMDWGPCKEEMEAGNYNLCLKIQGLPSANPFSLFKGFMYTEGGTNISYGLGYHNDHVDELIEEAAACLDAGRLTEIYTELQEISAVDFPNIPVLYSQEVVASSSDITGYQATVYGLTGFTQVCWAG